jgi:hypothetical protein
VTVADAHLRADCSRCMALCCVAPAFARSADFAIDKPAGTPCPNLADDFGCSIHETLRPRGFPGCTTYDCFGAGQQVTQHTYRGTTSWRSEPGAAGQVFRVFAVMRALHELLFYLSQAVRLTGPGALHDELEGLRAATDRLTREPAEVLDGFDVDGHRDRAVPLLRRASAAARAATAGARARALPRDLVGRDLRGADLVGADLRSAVLVAADLRGADVRLADVTGADLRTADVRGVDLSQVLFLSQLQVNAARGDDRTTLPAGLDRPGHWHGPTAG